MGNDAFHQQLCTALAVAGPRLSAVSLGASDEHQLVTWLMASPSNTLLNDRVQLLNDLIEVLGSSSNCKSFLTASCNQLGMSAAIFILTTQRGEFADSRSRLLLAAEAFIQNPATLTIDLTDQRMSAPMPEQVAA